MEIKYVYVAIFLLSVFVSSVSQIVLKVSANKTYASRIKEYINIQVIIAYVLFFVSSLMTVTAYRGIPLSMGPILEASGYIWVSVLGLLILKEKVSIRKWIGLFVIVIGIIIFSI